MTTYYVPKGTVVLRTKDRWGDAGSDGSTLGADWQNIRTTRAVTYTDADLVDEDSTYYIFRLDASATQPFCRVAVRKTKLNKRP